MDEVLEEKYKKFYKHEAVAENERDFYQKIWAFIEEVIRDRES